MRGTVQYAVLGHHSKSIPHQEQCSPNERLFETSAQGEGEGEGKVSCEASGIFCWINAYASYILALYLFVLHLLLWIL